MNEQACAYVCAIFSALCLIMSGYSVKTGDAACTVLTCVFAIIVAGLSGFVMVCRYL